MFHFWTLFIVKYVHRKKRKYNLKMIGMFQYCQVTRHVKEAKKIKKIRREMYILMVAVFVVCSIFNTFVVNIENNFSIKAKKYFVLGVLEVV